MSTSPEIIQIREDLGITAYQAGDRYVVRGPDFMVVEGIDGLAHNSEVMFSGDEESFWKTMVEWKLRAF